MFLDCAFVEVLQVYRSKLLDNVVRVVESDLSLLQLAQNSCSFQLLQLLGSELAVISVKFCVTLYLVLSLGTTSLVIVCVGIFPEDCGSSAADATPTIAAAPNGSKNSLE